MGGKKKTKWRKLPLEEFTQDILPKPEKVLLPDATKTDAARKESNGIASCSEEPEIIQNYAEPYEYIDGFWYPTSCVVYNPDAYSNCMVPVDTTYYYYTMPEAGLMQEYTLVPYQEYTHALPKDTVYLLMPTQTIQPIQPVQIVTPEWQNRRRRRRYEYADYAVIPNKNSLKSEENDCNKTPEHLVSPRESTAQSNNFKMMTSFTETTRFEDTAGAYNQACGKYGRKQNSTSSANISCEKGPDLANNETDQLNAETYLASKKNSEMCGVHSRQESDKNEQHTVGERFKAKSSYDEINASNYVSKTNKGGNSSSFVNDISNNPTDGKCIVSIDNKNKYTQRSKITHMSDIPHNKISNVTVLIHGNEKIEDNSLTNCLKLKDDIQPQTFAVQKNRTENTIETELRSSLPDILSSLNKAENSKLHEPDNSCDNIDLDKGKCYKSKYFITQTSHLTNFLSSEALHNEMEMELKQLQHLQSLQANQSIYKLAYDENITDQSEADSRSPSPVDPESQVPSSLTSAEILIHEADSGSDAGSEDVELIPHRYESETFLNENKHVYVNKLSLAVELLRTQETLPYDEEFKRVVGENNAVPGVHTGGKVNLGFVEDSCSPKLLNTTNNFKNKTESSIIDMNEIISQSQLKHSADSSNDSAIFSDVEFSNLEDETCEPAKEAVAQRSENQDNTEEIRAGYRRLGIQARHYFSIRTALSVNPCFCCIVM